MSECLLMRDEAVNLPIERLGVHGQYIVLSDNSIWQQAVSFDDVHRFTYETKL